MGEFEPQVQRPKPEGSDVEDKSDAPSDAEVKLEVEFPDGGLRAWSVVFGSACIGFVTFGFVNSFGVFQAYYQEILLPQISPSSISWIGSIQYALIFIPSLPTGRLVDLGYLRLPIAISSAGFIASVFLVAECKTYWQLVLCQGVAIGLFSGLLFGPMPACLSHWFRKKRFTAFGWLSVGSSVGGTILPIATRQLLGKVSYPWAIRILGFILILPIVLANLLLRTRLPPRKVQGGLFNWAAFKHTPYSLYVLAVIVTFLGLYVPLTYLDISAQHAGISPSISFYFISIANFASLIGRLSCGLLSDQYGAMNILIPFTFVAGIMSYAWPYATSIGSFVVVSLLYGCASGAFVAALPSPPSKMGGVEDVGRRIGMVGTCSAIGSIAGPPIAGAIQSASGGFKDMGAYAGSAIIVGCFFLLASRRVALGSWIGNF